MPPKRRATTSSTQSEAKRARILVTVSGGHAQPVLEMEVSPRDQDEVAERRRLSNTPNTKWIFIRGAPLAPENGMFEWRNGLVCNGGRVFFKSNRCLVKNDGKWEVAVLIGSDCPCNTCNTIKHCSCVIKSNCHSIISVLQVDWPCTT